MDINFTKSVDLLLIYLAMFLVLLIIAKPLKSLNSISTISGNVTNTEKSVFFIFYALCLIFAFNSSDFYSYAQAFYFQRQYVNVEYIGWESIFNWFANVTNNYVLWRAIIWGLAVLITYWTAVILKLNNRGFLLAVALFGFGLDVYTRGIIGHTMLVLGAVLFMDKKSNTLTKIIGLAIVCVSYYFHKSMYVNIIFAVLALFPFGKKTIIASFIAFPFLTTIATYLIDGIASGQIDMALGEGVGGVGDRATLYASQEKLEANFYGKIGKIIQILPEYLTLFYLYYKVIVQKIFDKDNKEKVYTYLFRLTYVAIYISSLFYFVETSSWIYERFKYMGFFPLVFVLGAVWNKEKYSSKWLKLIILLQLCWVFFSLFVTFLDYSKIS